jgi:hypothetical protein
LKDEDPIVTRAAAGALWQVGSPAVEPLIKALEEEKNTWVKFNSIIALGLIRDQRAMPALEKLLDHTQKEIEKKHIIWVYRDRQNPQTKKQTNFVGQKQFKSSWKSLMGVPKILYSL